MLSFSQTFRRCTINENSLKSVLRIHRWKRYVNTFYLTNKLDLTRVLPFYRLFFSVFFFRR